MEMVVILTGAGEYRGEGGVKDMIVVNMEEAVMLRILWWWMTLERWDAGYK